MKTRIALLVAATVLLAACGQKGPLYIPKDEPPAKQQPQG